MTNNSGVIALTLRYERDWKQISLLIKMGADQFKDRTVWLFRTFSKIKASKFSVASPFSISHCYSHLTLQYFQIKHKKQNSHCHTLHPPYKPFTLHSRSMPISLRTTVLKQNSCSSSKAQKQRHCEFYIWRTPQLCMSDKNVISFWKGYC